MLAANTSPRSAGQRSSNQAPAEDTPRKGKPATDDVQEEPKQLVIKIEEASRLALRQEEEEDDLDADADLDDDEIESELDDSTFTFQSEKATTPRTPKRSLEDMADTPEGVVDRKQEDVEREGTPPKRARLEDAESTPKQSIAPSPIRQRKRSSEELEDSATVVQSGKRIKA